MGESVPGQISVISLETRKPTFIEICNVAAILELKPDGPARILFTAGGHLDICGSAEIWRREIAVARLKLRTIIGNYQPPNS